MSPTNQELTTQLDRRLVGYAVLAAVAVAAPAISKADIIYSGVVNISVPNNFDGVYINFVTGQTGSSGASVPGWNWNPYNGGSGLQFFWNVSGNGGLTFDGTTYGDCPCSSTVGPSNIYLNTTSSAAPATWRAGIDGYLGVRLINSQSNQTNYGWVHFNTTGNTGFPATIVEYAFENTGQPITVGPLTCPEPSTPALLAVMAAGALGVRAWRKRKAD